MRIKDFSSTEEMIAFVEAMRSVSPSTTIRNAEQTKTPRQPTRMKEIAECDAASVDYEDGLSW